MKLMIISKKFIIVIIGMIGFMFAWRLLFSHMIVIGTLAALMMTICISFFYKEELKKIGTYIKNRKTST